ncbi:MAG: hypothetical protein JXQ75_21700 [Phycisphaerae bacterium]|nr:hypothetical protein [Phycisphaerae bacterium]
MPLAVKCGSCGRELLIEEVYSGAHCRCRYCRKLIRVPSHPQYTPKRPSVRPDAPPLAGARRTASLPSPVKTPPPSSARKKTRVNYLRSPATIAAIVLTATAGLAVAAWLVATPQGVQVADLLPPDADLGLSPEPIAEPSAAMDDPVLAMRTGNPLTTYFGFALEGEIVGYVVDGDNSMLPYIDAATLTTNTVNKSIEPGTRRYGIVRATSQEGHTVLEVYEPVSDLAGGRTILSPKLAGGNTDLSKALKKTEGWSADQIFLVLAKHIPDEQIPVLAQDAEQTYAVVNVIAFGEAAKQDLSPISDATGGKFLPITDPLLHDWVYRLEGALRQQQLAEEAAP